MAKTLEEINKEALDKVSVAQPILDKIKANPQLANVQDQLLSDLRIPYWNGHFVLNTLFNISYLYNVNTRNEVSENKFIPQKVKKFLTEAVDYHYGRF